MPKPKVYTRSVCFDLDESTYQRLVEISQKLLMPRAMVVRLALREYLRKYEAGLEGGLDVRPGSTEG